MDSLEAVSYTHLDLRGYSNHQYAKVAYYSDEILAGTYTIDQLDVTYNADGTLNEVTTKKFGKGFPKDADVTSINGNIVTIAGSGNFELKLRLTKDATFTDLDLDLEGFGAMDMQIGANEGQQLGIRIPKMSLENMGISNIDLSTAEGANEAIDKVDQAVSYTHLDVYKRQVLMRLHPCFISIMERKRGSGFPTNMVITRIWKLLNSLSI